ncbi:MAG: 2-amino-4-hydroxy-6-hydroxymethyldihydropteridine diphosphokinase [Bacteroidales bacterium]|nr:2-amino-4-hydroxy-6-hydroxymethyldihydropteridine diphosphokinase [Bacteroidales bacterium]
MSQKNFVVILLGANLGDKKKMFETVEKYLSENIGDCIKKSAIYSSKPWGFESENYFYNQALIIETDFSAYDTLKRCQAIETKCGRIRHNTTGYESRTIDIDLLYFNNDIIDIEELTIPHPLLQNRKFALAPLCEILPDFIHPILMKNHKQLLEECNDEGDVSVVC